jgi:DNA-3-methyladenine glycosylase II
MTDWDQQDTAELDERLGVLRRDPVMAGLIEEIEPPRADRVRRSLFYDLVDAIASQQLSVHAAAAIMRRVVALFPSNHPDPATLLTLSDEELRAAGLSRPKIRYLKGIARAVDSGEFDLDEAAELEDDAFVERLSTLPGVGRWTAEMLLIFALRRPDVFPVGTWVFATPSPVSTMSIGTITRQSRQLPRGGDRSAPSRATTCGAASTTPRPVAPGTEAPRGPSPAPCGRGASGYSRHAIAPSHMAGADHAIRTPPARSASAGASRSPTRPLWGPSVPCRPILIRKTARPARRSPRLRRFGGAPRQRRL